MRFRRGLVPLVVGIYLSGVSNVFGQPSIETKRAGRSDSIVVDIPLTEDSSILNLLIFNRHVKDCSTAKKVLAANGLDTLYSYHDTTAERSIYHAESLLKDDLTRLFVANTMVNVSISNALQEGNEFEAWRLEDEYIGAYGRLRRKYYFLGDSFFQGCFLRGF